MSIPPPPPRPLAISSREVADKKEKAAAMVDVAKCSAKANEAYARIIELERTMQKANEKQSFSVLFYASQEMTKQINQMHKGVRSFLTRCDSTKNKYPSLYDAERKELMEKSKTVKTALLTLCNGLKFLAKQNLDRTTMDMVVAGETECVDVISTADALIQILSKDIKMQTSAADPLPKKAPPFAGQRPPSTTPTRGAPPPPPPPPPPAKKEGGGSFLDMFRSGKIGAAKLKKQAPNSFSIRNLKCEPVLDGTYKTEAECEDAVTKIKGADALMAVMNTIDPQYRDALTKYEGKLAEIEKARANLKKAAGNENRINKLNKEIERLQAEADALGNSASEMETEFRATIPTDVGKMRNLIAEIKKSGGVDSYKEYANLYKDSTGEPLKLPARMKASVGADSAAPPPPPRSSPAAAAAAAPEPVRVAEIPVSRAAAASGQPVIVNIYNNIVQTQKGSKMKGGKGEKYSYASQLMYPPAAANNAKAASKARAAASNAKAASKVTAASRKRILPAPLQRGQKACVNCPPLPPPGKKQKLDTYILGKNGRHQRLYMGSRGALYTYNQKQKKYKPLGVMSKII